MGRYPSFQHLNGHEPALLGSLATTIACSSPLLICFDRVFRAFSAQYATQSDGPYSRPSHTEIAEDYCFTVPPSSSRIIDDSCYHATSTVALVAWCLVRVAILLSDRLLADSSSMWKGTNLIVFDTQDAFLKLQTACSQLNI